MKLSFASQYQPSKCSTLALWSALDSDLQDLTDHLGFALIFQSHLTLLSWSGSVLSKQWVYPYTVQISVNGNKVVHLIVYKSCRGLHGWKEFKKREYSAVGLDHFLKSKQMFFIKWLSAGFSATSPKREKDEEMGVASEKMLWEQKPWDSNPITESVL